MGQGKSDQVLKRKAKLYVKKMSQQPDTFWYKTIFLKKAKGDIQKAIEIELAGQRFWNACHKLGAYGGPEIEELLQKGSLPVEIIEEVLIKDYNLGGNDYLFIAQGYKGKLSPEAEQILNQHILECRAILEIVQILQESDRRYRTGDYPIQVEPVIGGISLSPGNLTAFRISKITRENKDLVERFKKAMPDFEDEAA